MTELGLGTANWGTTYGAPGRQAHVDLRTALLLAQAFTSAGHGLVDTAPAYGRAEALVGQVFQGSARVVTKLALPDGAPDDVVSSSLSCVERSCAATGTERLAGVLLHDPHSAVTAPTTARRVLDALRGSGLVERVGVSVYSPAEASRAVEVLGADLLQVPCNLLDQRFLRGDLLRRLAAGGVEVHVRSVFLNGVLLADPGSLTGPLLSLREPVRCLHAALHDAELTPVEGALAFARQLGAAAVVCGAFALEQLDELLALWARVTPVVTEFDWEAFAAGDEVAIDPRRWSR